eukprot:130768-Chlamydomonas_euryale.AAC.4
MYQGGRCAWARGMACTVRLRTGLPPVPGEVGTLGDVWTPVPGEMYDPQAALQANEWCMPCAKITCFALWAHAMPYGCMLCTMGACHAQWAHAMHHVHMSCIMAHAMHDSACR